MILTIKAIYITLQIAPILALSIILPHTIIKYSRTKNINVRWETYIYSFVLYLICAYFMTMLPLPSEGYFDVIPPLIEQVQLSRPNKSVVLGTDNETSLKARVDGAEAFKAEYFISLHINSFTSDSANGIEVYTAESGNESYIFGQSLLNGLLESTELGDRGMKLGPEFYVLKHATMPAALLEMGFISNSSDAALLDEHPELFAQGIYKGILDYFGLLPNIPVTP